MMAKINKLLGNPERMRGGSFAWDDCYCKLCKDQEGSI